MHCHLLLDKVNHTFISWEGITTLAKSVRIADGCYLLVTVVKDFTFIELGVIDHFVVGLDLRYLGYLLTHI
jgi:hypothetical protein